MKNSHKVYEENTPIKKNFFKENKPPKNIKESKQQEVVT